MHAKDTMRRLGLGLCLLVSVGIETLGQPPASARGKTQDWPYYGGPGQTRYSPLKQITRENVNQLQVAWTFDTKDTTPRSIMQIFPLIAAALVKGVEASGGFAYTMLPVSPAAGIAALGELPAP